MKLFDPKTKPKFKAYAILAKTSSFEQKFHYYGLCNGDLN